jgi:hypothetical protein
MSNIVAISRDVPAERHADALVRDADLQAIGDIVAIATPLEEADEVALLQAFQPADGLLVAQHLARLGLAEQELVELLDDAVHLLLGEGRSAPRRVRSSSVNRKSTRRRATSRSSIASFSRLSACAIVSG